ncbi:hypothetical protein ARMSODRAFT_770348 [Armillaria solidipes]|uniref:Uncharacterized protein n=1 Tax=Armillaria solidipes TaxID=1076256 RepID=A0A2H3B9T7_9AGAR|nr:hypothetical protein ARMSODRAFT_770348 [Armillaria solidipes]
MVTLKEHIHSTLPSAMEANLMLGCIITGYFCHVFSGGGDNYASYILEHIQFMASQTNIPTNLTGDGITAIFQSLDATLGAKILLAQLIGLYTGVFFVASWYIFVKKTQPIGRALTAAIILLYILTAILFAIDCMDTRQIFADNGMNFWSEYTAREIPATTLAGGIMGALCTALSDSALIWRCWMVWNFSLPVVILPILLLASAVGGSARFFCICLSSKILHRAQVL